MQCASTLLLILIFLIWPSNIYAGKFDGLSIGRPQKTITKDVAKRNRFDKLICSDKFCLVNNEEKTAKILLFTASWCVPCQAIHSRKSWAEEAGWIFDKHGHIEIVDIDNDPQRFYSYNGGQNSIPRVSNIETRETIVPGSMLDVLNFALKEIGRAHV